MFSSQLVSLHDVWVTSNSHVKCSLCCKFCVDAVQLDCKHSVPQTHSGTREDGPMWRMQLSD